jgi:hypothetical protein
MSLFNQQVEDTKEIYPKITHLDELLQEICYAYEDQYGPIERDTEGVYYVYKLTIGKNWMQYKQHMSYIVPGVYEQMEKFFSIKIES